VKEFSKYSTRFKARWLLKPPRFLFAAGLTLFLHLKLTELASWVCARTAPPNVSPDAGQPWMDRHYVTATADYSLTYAFGILLAGNMLTGLLFYLLGRKQLSVEWWAVGAAWSPAILGELFALFFMHPW
jgi:hypothetical protein